MYLIFVGDFDIYDMPFFLLKLKYCHRLDGLKVKIYSANMENNHQTSQYVRFAYDKNDEVLVRLLCVTLYLVG